MNVVLSDAGVVHDGPARRTAGSGEPKPPPLAPGVGASVLVAKVWPGAYGFGVVAADAAEAAPVPALFFAAIVNV